MFSFSNAFASHIEQFKSTYALEFGDSTASGSQVANNNPKTMPPNSRRLNSPEECAICRLEFVHFPSFPPTELCLHPSQVCHGCLQETITVAVANGDVRDGIACPIDTCDKRMEFGDVKTWAKEADFEAYDILLLKLQLGDEEEFIRCLSVSCTAGQFHSGADDTPVITCYSCGAKQCYQHRSAWHEGFTCTQWDEIQRTSSSSNHDISEKLITTITKACPGPGCGRRIQKAEGCNHMQCKKPGGCGFEFCWLCLAPYKPIRRHDNSMHYDSCEYYSGSPGGNPAPMNAAHQMAETSRMGGQSITAAEWDRFFDQIDEEEADESDDEEDLEDEDVEEEEEDEHAEEEGLDIFDMFPESDSDSD